MARITHRLDWGGDHWDIILETAKTAEGDAVMSLDDFLSLADQLKTDLLLADQPAPQRPAPRRRP